MELTPPTLEWNDETPYAAAFDDIYYMPENGLAESHYVFVAANQLSAQMAAAGRDGCITIGETGFGTGLNFLALLQEWARIADNERPRLHYITTEAFPLSASTLTHAHERWPELAAYSTELVAHYPPLIAGAHRRLLFDGRVTIDFLFGDAAPMLANYRPSGGVARPIDAWFLDGFAPAKNPDMWSDALFNAMADLSHAGTRLATFTAAGKVRRGLQQAGFEVQKVPGYGRKREMVIGHLPAEAASPQWASTCDTPLVIIGAGVAGVSMGWQSAKQGRHCVIIEQAANICAAASGNPASSFTPFYGTKWNERSRMLASGFAMMQHVLAYFATQGHTIIGEQQGMLMLAPEAAGVRSERLRQWQESLTLPEDIRRTVTAEQASELAGVTLPHTGWHYPQGGWVNMRSLCDAMRADAGEAIDWRFGQRVTALEHEASTGWRVHCADGTSLLARQVVIATAQAAVALLPELKVSAVHGQSLTFTPPPEWQVMRKVVHAGHALIPLPDGRLQWGSSFRHHVEEPLVRDDERARLLEDLALAFPQLAESAAEQPLEEWAQFRCTHASHLPLIGQVPGQPEGLHLHIAHGARGLLTGIMPFAAELFATAKA